MEAQAFNLSTLETEEGGSLEFEASLIYIVYNSQGSTRDFCLKNKQYPKSWRCFSGRAPIYAKTLMLPTLQKTFVPC